MYQTLQQLRQSFVDFFVTKGHTRVDSSSLVPTNDPSLLFTNAGMVQFKDIFLGLQQPEYPTAVTVQKCMRAGGKHNDLENVGYTARHHTFFEMLGNFSFGAYFKRDAIFYAWEFLTTVLQLPPEKLWVTVYKDDQEAEDIWLKEVGVAPQRFARCGTEDNFWMMGDVGPCGPCTEIFYDHGPAVAGGPPGSATADGDRYVEVWNLVFMQYSRDAAGNMTPLPRPCVDTGMGLERLAAVVQGVHSNYDIDLFKALRVAIGQQLHVTAIEQPSVKVIADHMRSVCFLLADGVVPSNEGRGYVLRRIIRRAVRHGYKLGCNQPFLYNLVPVLVELMHSAYPQLTQDDKRISAALLREEQQFARTVQQGMELLEVELAKLQGLELSGATVFKLYDTYGFPADLTCDIARERGIAVNMTGFDEACKQHQTLSRQHTAFHGVAMAPTAAALSEFVGYEAVQANTDIVAIYVKEQMVQTISTGTAAALVLTKTPFYAEAGGQVGDRGQIIAQRDPGSVFLVHNTTKVGDSIVHHGTVQAGKFAVQTAVTAQVDEQLRNATRRNHSATHLLHAVLRKLLGTQVVQKGSYVGPDYLRFDFTCAQPVSVAQLQQINTLVNELIYTNTAVTTKLLPLQEAKATGAMALFGEKYSAVVRVLTMADGMSVELCGGTHVAATGDIGTFWITEETSVAAGVRRITALTGAAAVQYLWANMQELQQIASMVHASLGATSAKIANLQQELRLKDKTLAQTQAKLSSSTGKKLLDNVVMVGAAKVLVAELQHATLDTLRQTMDQVKQELLDGISVLAAIADGKVILVAWVGSSYQQQLPAGKLVNFVAELVGGRGGGRADMAQAGGTKPEALQQALQQVVPYIAQALYK